MRKSRACSALLPSDATSAWKWLSGAVPARAGELFSRSAAPVLEPSMPCHAMPCHVIPLPLTTIIVTITITITITFTVTIHAYVRTCVHTYSITYLLTYLFN